MLVLLFSLLALFDLGIRSRLIVCVPFAGRCSIMLRREELLSLGHSIITS
jgi:hypothetical protein